MNARNTYNFGPRFLREPWCSSHRASSLECGSCSNQLAALSSERESPLTSEARRLDRGRHRVLSSGQTLPARSLEVAFPNSCQSTASAKMPRRVTLRRDPDGEAFASHLQKHQHPEERSRLTLR